MERERAVRNSRKNGYGSKVTNYQRNHGWSRLRRETACRAFLFLTGASLRAASSNK